MTSDPTTLLLHFCFNHLKVTLNSTASVLCCRFDLLANGGASLTLSFERAPFLTQYRTVWLPWNVFHVMDTLVMKKVNSRGRCLQSAWPGCENFVWTPSSQIIIHSHPSSPASHCRVSTACNNRGHKSQMLIANC